MSKAIVTRFFLGGLVAIAGGLVLMLVTAIVGASTGAFIMRGPDVVGVQPTAYGGTMVALAVLSVLAILGGGLSQFVAWVGAVLNTAKLEDKTWFLLLLLLGLLSFGFVAMLIYVVVGPDGAAAAEQARPLSARPTAA